MPTILSRIPFKRPAFHENHYLSATISWRERYLRHCCFLLILGIVVLLTPPLFADVISGYGESKLGEPIHMGPVAIPWSKANDHFGYVYRVPGLSFANVFSGPSVWQPTIYQSYSGFPNIQEIVSVSSGQFSSPEMIVFSASKDAGYENQNRGILLIQYYHTYGALYFSNLSGDKIRYYYWYNPTGQCAFNYNAAPDDSSEPEPVIREYYQEQELSQLEITGGDTWIFNNGLKVSDTLTITDGKLILRGESSVLNHITIKEAGSLELLPDAVVSIQGNLQNKGTLIAEEGTLVLIGKAIQFVLGELVCYALEIENPYFVVTETLFVQELAIFEGVLLPGRNSQFHNIFIDQTGKLYVAYKATISITGNIDNEGTFYHNYGTVMLTGDERQYLLMDGDAFYNLDVIAPEIMIDILEVTNLLTVSPGSVVSILDDPL